MRDRSTPRPIIRQRLAFTLKVSYSWLAWNIGDKKYYEELYPTEQFQLTTPERLVYLIWKNKKNPEVMAQELNISNTAIQYWMEGKRLPSNNSLYMLADYFNVDTTWLTTGLSDTEYQAYKMMQLKSIHSATFR